MPPPPRPNDEAMELLHDLGYTGSSWHHVRQSLEDVVIQPAPTGVQVTFRTTLKAVAAVFVYRVSGGDFAADSQWPGAIVAYQVDDAPVRQHSARLREQQLSGEPLEQDTLYWVRIVCPDKDNANIEFVRKIRTWKRTAVFEWTNLEIIDDSDAGGRGELLFALQVFDNGNGSPITELQYSSQMSLNSGKFLGSLFGKNRIDLAPDVLGFYISGSDDDGFGVFYVASGYETAPWNHRHREWSNGGWMGADSSLIYDIFALPDAQGSSSWTLKRRTLEGGRLQFRAYIQIDVEVIATSQPLNWWPAPSPWDQAIAVVDLGDFLNGVDVGSTSSEKRARDQTTRLTHTPDGALIFATPKGRKPRQPVAERQLFSQVKVVRSRGGKEPPTLVASDKSSGLRLGKIHLDKTPRIEWEAHGSPVRGEPTIAARAGGSWEIIALSVKGEPISIGPNGKPSVIGPAIDLDPVTIIAAEAAIGWYLVVANGEGKQFVLLRDGKAAAWTELPAELGNVLRMKVRADGEAILLGLGPDRTVRLWTSKRRKIETFTRLEEFDLPPTPAPPKVARDVAHPSATRRANITINT